MNKKYLIILLISAVFLSTVGSVSAEAISNDTVQLSEDINEENTISTASNEEEVLESSYFYDIDDDDVYVDDELTINAKNVKTYYNDGSSFKATISNENGTKETDLLVYVMIDGKTVKKAYTNAKGVATFKIPKLNVGIHDIVTFVAEGDGEIDSGSFWFKANTITVKTTVPTKTLTKSIKQKNKKFQIKFLNKKGKALTNKKIKIKVKSKIYTVKTNSKGIAKIKINVFKKGTHKIYATNTATGEKKTIKVKITK